MPLLQVIEGGFPLAAELLLGSPLRLGAERVHAFERQATVRRLPIDPMAALRALVAGAESDAAAPIIAEVGVALARIAAQLKGTAPLPPDPQLDHATDLARMLLLRHPNAYEAGALSRYLATVMDHGLNASTFAARVVASTGSDATSAVVAAIGALKGPLHGGAPGPVLDMLDAIDEAGDAEAWIAAELIAGRRIMGMGHRVYRVRDPRAAALETALIGLHTSRLASARHVERVAERLLAERYPARPLRANVEFYTAILLEALGVPRPLFTVTFAAGRVVGWMAHIAEQRADGHILRPRAEWVGAALHTPAAGETNALDA